MIFQSLQEFLSNISSNKKVICFDIGEKKIGVAISDYNKWIASPFDILFVNQSKDIYSDIVDLIIAEDIGAIVYGLPLNLEGIEGENCEKIRKFAEKISEKIDLPIYFQDERLSTQAVNRVMKDAGVKRKKRNSIDDKLAASYILQIVLDNSIY